MAINKNHLFDDLNGIKCAIVETEVPTDRVNFLKSLLEFNKFTVVVIPSPPPKGTPAPAVTAEGDASPTPPLPPEKFTVGVTDVTFNMTNVRRQVMIVIIQNRIVTFVSGIPSISK